MSNKFNSENLLISRRAFVLGIGKLGFLAILAMRLFYMQVMKGSVYSSLSEKNRIRIIVVPASRGQIYDIKNELLASNEPCFQLFIEKIGSENINIDLEYISELLKLDEEQVNELKKKANKTSMFIPTVIIDNLNWSELSKLEERKNEFKNFFTDIGYKRLYSAPFACCHILGYLGKQNLNIYEGMNGIEKFYENKLSGTHGNKQLEVNSKGKYIKLINSIPCVSGHDLKLNIDLQTQNYIQKILPPSGSSAITLCCKTGAVLSLNSSPSFDPNKFYNLSNKYWNLLNSDSFKPLINKTVSTQYPPGSVFKIVTALAALESGHDPEEKILCQGHSFLGTNSFRCAKSQGHGYINLTDAIKYSCNTYIFYIAKKYGPEIILDVAKALGFGQLTGIDIPGEKPGFLPSQEWKKSKFNTNWSIGDTLNLSIGQGYTLVTPIQLTRMIAAIASEGKLFMPRIIISNVTYTKLKISSDNIKIIKKALYKVINEPGGTGYNNKLTNTDIAMSGKTGTAQVLAKKHKFDNLSRSNIAWNRRNHAIITSYAPSIDPKYALCVFYDHGGTGGSAAAPIGKKIMQHLITSRETI